MSSIPAVFLIYGGKVVDSFVGIPERERLQDFFNKAVVMDQINHDPNVQNAILEKAEDLLRAEDYETAMGVLADLIQYDNMRAKYEWQMITGIASCLVFKFKDFPRAEEMIQMITPENREALNEFYKGLLEKTEKEIAHNKSLGSAETPNT